MVEQKFDASYTRATNEQIDPPPKLPFSLSHYKKIENERLGGGGGERDSEKEKLLVRDIAQKTSQTIPRRNYN